MAKESRTFIKIRGANEHNLKNIDLEIPRNELVVMTGLSGSGKSSLAFDTIYAEGRRYDQGEQIVKRAVGQSLAEPGGAGETAGAGTHGDGDRRGSGD